MAEAHPKSTSDEKPKKVSVDVSHGQLAPITKLMASLSMSSTPMTPMSAAFLEHMRMVFDGFNQKQAISALNVLPLVEHLFQGLGANFEGDITRFYSIAKAVRDQPYIGLQNVLPQAHHFQSWPRLGLLGEKYYFKCLESLESIWNPNDDHGDANFRKHMSSEEYHICMNILSTLAPNRLLGLAAKMEFLSLNEAKSLLRREEVSDLEVMFHLLDARIACEWRDDFMRELRKSVMKPVIQEAQELIQNVADLRLSELLAIDRKRSLRDGSAKSDQLQKILSQDVKARLKEEDLLEYNPDISNASPFVSDTVVNRYILFLSKIYFIIRRVSYDKVDGLMEELNEVKTDLLGKLGIQPFL